MKNTLSGNPNLSGSLHATPAMYNIDLGLTILRTVHQRTSKNATLIQPSSHRTWLENDPGAH